MSLVPRDPLGDVFASELFPSAFGALAPFGGAFANMWPFPTEGGALATQLRPLAVDIREEENKFVVSADVPGLNKNEVDVSADGQVLRLTVNKEEEKEEKTATYHRVERSSRYQSRALRFPESADLTKAAARLENGVLMIDLPKHAHAAKKTAGNKIQIQ